MGDEEDGRSVKRHENKQALGYISRNHYDLTGETTECAKRKVADAA